MDRCPNCCVTETELQIQSLDSSESADENESEQLIILLGKKKKKVMRTQQMVLYSLYL